MQQVLAKMIDTIASLLESFSGSGNNLATAGLGAGGLGISAEIVRRMLVSPETEKAMKEFLPEGRDVGLGRAAKTAGNGMYQPTESDFRGWRNEINTKMDRQLEKMGLDKDAARLFKQRTGNLAYQIDRVCRRYNDPVIRNQKVSELIDRQIKQAVETSQRQGKDTVMTERLTLAEKEREMGAITGGMKEKPAFFNGITSSNGVPVWVPDTSVNRLETSAAEMDKMHKAQVDAVEKATRKATEKLSLQSINEGIKKGLFTADDLLRKGTDMYAGGDNLLLGRLGLISKYEDYKSSLLLDNPSRAGRIWGEMRQGAMDYIREIRGEGTQVIGQEITMADKLDQHTGMGFGLKF